MSRTQLLSYLVVFFFAITSVQAKQVNSASNTEISWHKSGMPQALQLAKSQNRPLFVYWGAVWCPPCNVVKTTLFKDALFILATGDYIAVYLDGDTEEAQKWGEKLKVMGYPTLMILSPDGKEVLRLSPGNSVEDLVSTMNYAKNEWNPISEVLNQTLTSKSIDAHKVQSLAMYSWSQDKDVNDNAAEYAQKLFQLESKLKNTQLNRARSIIFVTALNLKIESLEEDQQLKKFLKEKYRDRVKSILNQPDLLKANILNLAYEAENLVTQLTDKKSVKNTNERLDFIQLYEQKMRQYRSVNNLPFDHYYPTFNPSIDFAEGFEVNLEDNDKKQLTAYTSEMLLKTKNKKARQALVSDASYTLFKYGLKKQAKQMLIAEMKISENPYYLMSTLGYFEKEEGNNVEALEWYEKSYKAASGPATKLQWYGSYVRHLISLKPEDKAAIKLHVNTLLSDYTNMVDSFWGRNYRVLLSLQKSTTKWAEENKEASWINEIKQQGLKKCSLSKTEIYKSGCKKFYHEFI